MSEKSIAILTSGHNPLDDRLYYHFGKSLAKKYKVTLVSSSGHFKSTDSPIEVIGFEGNNLTKEQKVRAFIQYLSSIHPFCIICAEPLPILAAHRYKKKINNRIQIIYDITEWYPSKKNIENASRLNAIAICTKLLVFNVYAASLSNKFIFGEYYKSLPYRILFPWKKSRIISYYPDLDYINYQAARLFSNQICLGYTGRISSEKGITHFFDLAKELQKRKPSLTIKLKIIGWFVYKKDEEDYNRSCYSLQNIDVQLLNRQPFEILSNSLADIDIFFDLREPNIENQHCLPIKLFYYAACGRPVIYSRLKAITNVFPNLPFGYLVNPADSKANAQIIENYLEKPSVYYLHCQKARDIACKQYNWSHLEYQLFEFIEHTND
jgi:glycosyltransferase involved in cell wall biosynthesis